MGSRVICEFQSWRWTDKVLVKTVDNIVLVMFGNALLLVRTSFDQEMDGVSVRCEKERDEYFAE